MSELYREYYLNERFIKHNFLEKIGIIKEKINYNTYKVITQDGNTILTTTSGKTRLGILKNSELEKGDIVLVETSLYDSTKGRIIKKMN